MEREHKSQRKPTFAEREKYFEAERETLRKNLGEPGQKILEIDFLSGVKSSWKAYTTPTHNFAAFISVFSD